MAIEDKPQYNNNFIDSIRRLSAILAILPPSSFFNPNHNKLSSFYKCYTILMLLVILSGFTLEILGRFKDVYHIIPAPTLLVTDLTVAFSITAANVASVLAPTVWYLKDYKSFSKIYDTINYCLMNCKSIKAKTCKMFCMELIVGHLVLFVIFACDAYIWINGVGLTQYRHYIFSIFQRYHLYVTAIAIQHFALLANYGFKMINNGLKQLNGIPPYRGNGIAPLEVEMEKYEYYNTVREYAQRYEIEIKQIVLFNKIFGWQILFLIVALMMGLLNSFDILTLYFPQEKEEYEVVKESFGSWLVILSAVWALWHLSLGAIVAVSCTSTIKTAQETADICFTILLKLPVIPTNAKERALKNELTLLRDLAVQRCPTFSAAGFFTVDYSLFLATFASVTSYVIVLIQFHK